MPGASISDRFWRWRHGWPVPRAQPWFRAARAAGLYPGYADFGGAMALDASGAVWVAEDMADWSARAPVEHPGIAFAVTVHATRRYPQIAHLRPERQPGDPDCPSCGGAGFQRELPPRLRYSILCECGGGGWVPRSLAGLRRSVTDAG